MTTKFLDNKICTFEISLPWRFPRITAFFDDFPLCPQGPPPSKVQILPLLSSRRLWIIIGQVVVLKNRLQRCSGFRSPFDSLNPHVPSWAIFLSEEFRGSVWASPSQEPATLVLQCRMGVRVSSQGPPLGGQIPPKLTSDHPALIWPALG